MAILTMCSADTQDLSIIENVSSYITISSAKKRTGTYSYRIWYNRYSIRPAIPAVYDFYGQVAAADIAPGLQIFPYTGTAATIYIEYSGSSFKLRLGAYNATPVLEVPYLFKNWDVIEFHIVTHPTNGSLQIRVNGVQVLDYSGDTGTGPITSVGFHPIRNEYMYLDDIIFDDSDWPGLASVEVLRPNNDGYYQNWDTGGYTNVNTASDATNVATDAAVNSKISFILPSPTVTPAAVGLFTKNLGPGTLRPFFRKNSIDTPGAQVDLTTSLLWAKDYQIEMPDEVGLETII